MSEAEERHLLYDWNEVAPHSEPERLLHELFEDQAKRTPDNVALVLDNEKLIYRELNAHANDLAQHVRELRVGLETLVGLYMERSIEMVIAVLGISSPVAHTCRSISDVQKSGSRLCSTMLARRCC